MRARPLVSLRPPSGTARWRRSNGRFLAVICHLPVHTATVRGAAMTDTRVPALPSARHRPATRLGGHDDPGPPRGLIITAADPGRLRLPRFRAGEGRSRRPEPGTA